MSNIITSINNMGITSTSQWCRGSIQRHPGNWWAETYFFKTIFLNLNLANFTKTVCVYENCLKYISEIQTWDIAKINSHQDCPGFPHASSCCSLETWTDNIMKVNKSRDMDEEQ